MPGSAWKRWSFHKHVHREVTDLGQVPHKSDETQKTAPKDGLKRCCLHTTWTSLLTTLKNGVTFSPLLSARLVA